ncbi:MAG: transketolase [Chloroflexi bacterium]|nr:transketolase [Chloroflexota bacterium]
MRTAFIEALCEAAAQDERIWLLTGDLGYSVLERFSTRFPERYLNVGVAEQNMAGVAAGLALCGKIVFTYSIANFPTLRCLEQIRNDVCYHRANVKLVAVGGGLTYGALGFTHHGLEDLAIMRALPDMTVIAPGDPAEARAATRAVVDRPGPCYLRLGKAGEPRVHEGEPDFRIGRAITVREGSALTLVSTGGVLKLVVEAARMLAQRKIDARILSMPTLKPLDVEALLHAAEQTKRLVTVEEHSLIGGLASAVAEALCAEGVNGVRVRSLGTSGKIEPRVGSQDYLRGMYGLSVDAIVAAAETLL